MKLTDQIQGLLPAGYRTVDRQGGKEGDKEVSDRINREGCSMPCGTLHTVDRYDWNAWTPFAVWSHRPNINVTATPQS
jgi:hypothetical protein